jgi:hypothetical protein
MNKNNNQIWKKKKEEKRDKQIFDINLPNRKKRGIRSKSNSSENKSQNL